VNCFDLGAVLAVQAGQMKFALVFLLTALLPLSNLFAGSATWNFKPISTDWNMASNWTAAVRTQTEFMPLP
jgi:hypothetical protein